MADQLAYQAMGAGPSVVFLHGIAANHRHWKPVVQRLAERHRCINVDLLGHGDSPAGGAVDLFAQVGAVVSLLANLELETPVVVGHSYGAFVATFASTVVPIRGVVNVDQTFDTGAFRTVIEPLADRLRGDDLDSAFHDFLVTQRPELVPRERQELLRSNIEPRREVVLGVWGSVLEMPPEELRAQVEAVLPTVTAPYLALFGTTPSAEERRLQALIPSATVEVWDGCGHFLHLVDPDRTAQRIIDFVDTLP